jgi:hypothetical protein
MVTNCALVLKQRRRKISGFDHFFMAYLLLRALQAAHFGTDGKVERDCQGHRTIITLWCANKIFMYFNNIFMRLSKLSGKHLQVRDPLVSLWLPSTLPGQSTFYPYDPSVYPTHAVRPLCHSPLPYTTQPQEFLPPELICNEISDHHGEGEETGRVKKLENFPPPGSELSALWTAELQCHV